MARLLVVVAHPDDETFGCGSLLLHAAAQGMVTAVLCATRGEAGEVADPGSSPEPDTLGALRERETRAAADVLGVSTVSFLGFRDSGMAGDAGPGTLVGAPLAAVRDGVRERIETFAPSVVVTLDGSDGHRDHERIREATLAAAADQDCALYLHCLPQSLMRRWVEHMAATDPSWEHLRGDVPGTPEELITTELDTAPQLAARERAMRLHASQRSPFDNLPAGLRRDFLTTERLRRLRPEWTGGPIENALTATGKDHQR